MANIFSSAWEKIKKTGRAIKESAITAFTPSPGTGASDVRRGLASVWEAIKSPFTRPPEAPIQKGPTTPFVKEMVQGPKGAEMRYRPPTTMEAIRGVPQMQQQVAENLQAYLKGQPYSSGEQSYYQPSVTQPSQPTWITQGSYRMNPETGQRVPLPQAPSGEPGISQPLSYTPLGAGGLGALGAQGAPGIAGGRSAFTGILGAASGLSLGGLPIVPTEEEKRIQQIKPTPITTVEQATTAGRAAAQARRVSPIAPPITTTEGMVDLTTVQKRVNEITELLRNPISDLTRSQLSSYLDTAEKQLLTQLQSLKPIPEEPVLVPEVVAEDEDQLDKLYKIEKQIYEDTQRDLGIPKLITDYENALKSIQATQAVYDAVIKDIQGNPEYPKGLAARRIKAIQDEEGVRLKSLQSTAELLANTLNLKRQEFADRMGITQRAVARKTSEEERTRKNAREQIQLMINTAAIGDFSDAELDNLAKSAGYTIQSLRAIRTAVKTGNERKIANAQSKLEIQEGRLRLAEEKMTMPTTEEKAETFDEIVLEAAPMFEEDRMRNEDKKISPDLYSEMRARVPATYRNDFDAKFSYLLSKETKRRYGIETEDVFGNIKALMAVNAPRKDIEAYIRLSGYDVNSPEIQDLIRDYQLKKHWWQK